MAKTVYERMAGAGPIVRKTIDAVGTAPHRTHVLRFAYANGLVVSYDGTERGFVVVYNETKTVWSQTRPAKVN